jgi:uncharacterized membrane protein YeaQ/YmgE (transglycosylase-associated protein family)
MFSLIGWIVCGLVAGSIAEWVVPLDKPSPGWQTIGTGVAGSVVGGMVNGLLTGDAYSPAGLVWSVIGAVLCLFVYRWFTARGL